MGEQDVGNYFHIQMTKFVPCLKRVVSHRRKLVERLFAPGFGPLKFASSSYEFVLIKVQLPLACVSAALVSYFDYGFGVFRFPTPWGFSVKLVKFYSWYTCWVITLLGLLEGNLKV